MTGARLNCWEYQGCGREPGGARSHRGVCPAATAELLDGANSGSFGGRSCWIVDDTLCGGRPQGGYASKACECAKCSFMHRVEIEESLEFASEPDLLRIYRGGTAPEG